jgi:hypothetical protein
MPFTKIVARVVVDKRDRETVVKHLQSCIDALVARRVPVFDSGLTTSLVCEVEDADEIRREMAF